MGSAIRIVTDSVADVPWALARQLGIAVVPIYLILDGKGYTADASLDTAWFYDEVMRLGAVPRTAAPPPGEFLAVYRRLAAEGAHDIVGLFLDSSLSSIVSNARQAAIQAQDDVRVHIVETAQVSMGVGWLAIAAAEAVLRGIALDDLLALLNGQRERTLVVGMLDSLEFLRRGGRVSWAAARLVDFLQIKPMVSYQNGTATLAGRVRTYNRAVQSLIVHVQKSAPLERLTILHSHVEPSVLAHLQTQLADCAPSKPIPIIEVGPIFSTHVGPRAVGVALVCSEMK